ncbi:MAG: lysozyme inhibitor LprI family protein [Sphingomicrobium sp.]
MILALLLVAADVPAAPDDERETACYEADQSQQGMNRCAGETYARADAALNIAWAKVVAAYKGDQEGSKLLLDAQRGWLKYREAQCRAAAIDSKGGSIWPMMVASCMADMTRRRTHELVVMVEGEAN